MTKKERALKLIEDLMKKDFRYPKRFGTTVDTYIFNSYQAWAIRELYKYSVESQEKDPIIIFDNWICICNNLSCGSKKENWNFRWSVASDVGTQVLDEWLILAEEYNDTDSMQYVSGSSTGLRVI